jgi:hypothetical protein
MDRDGLSRLDGRELSGSMCDRQRTADNRKPTAHRNLSVTVTAQSPGNSRIALSNSSNTTAPSDAENGMGGLIFTIL